MYILFQVLQLWSSQLHKRTFCIFFQGQIIFSQSLQAVSFWLCTLRVRRVPRQISAECPLFVYFSFKVARVSIYFHTFLCWHFSFFFLISSSIKTFVTDSCSGGFSLHCPNNVSACKLFWPFVSPCKHYPWHKTGIASPPPSSITPGIELKLSLLSNIAPDVEVNFSQPTVFLTLLLVRHWCSANLCPVHSSTMFRQFIISLLQFHCCTYLSNYSSQLICL